MSEIWFEETLYPDPDILEELVEGVRDLNLKHQLGAVRKNIRIHMPRAQLLDSKQKESITGAKSDADYFLVRLGCEFDPDQKPRATFVNAYYFVYLWPEGNLFPKVYDLAPLSLDAGGPQVVSVKLSPAIKTVTGAEMSFGEIGTNVNIGRVAPIIRGFKGDDEMSPRWDMEHHGEAPIHGIRHFWLWLEIPKAMQHCFISCRGEGLLQTTAGKLLFVPKKRRFDHRHRIDLLAS